MNEATESGKIMKCVHQTLAYNNTLYLWVFGILFVLLLVNGTCASVQLYEMICRNTVCGARYWMLHTISPVRNVRQCERFIAAKNLNRDNSTSMYRGFLPNVSCESVVFFSYFFNVLLLPSLIFGIFHSGVIVEMRANEMHS